jgi:hypothetical protein
MMEYLIEDGKGFDAWFWFIFFIHKMKIAWNKLNKLRGYLDPS